MAFYRLVVGVLSVWRITHMLYGEDGPWDLLARLRRLAGAGMLGKLMDCFYCLSVWVAIPFALLLGHGWMDRLLLVPALSAGAILLQRATSARRPGPPAAVYMEYDEEDDDGMLRREEEPVPHGDGGQPDV